LTLKFFGTHGRAEVNREASRSAMLIQRTCSHAGASKAQHHRPAHIERLGKEFACETIEADRALRPRLTRALGGKAPDRARQIAHQDLPGTRLERDDRVVLDSHRSAELSGKKISQVDRQSASELQAFRFEIDFDRGRTSTVAKLPSSSSKDGESLQALER
jgi:hypothetical protein